MDVVIDEILENYVYYIDDRNIIDSHKELTEAKQIAAESRRLECKWSDDNNFDKNEHVKEIYELSKKLLVVLQANSLHEIFKTLSQLQINSMKTISDEDALSRKRLILADIIDFYYDFKLRTILYIKAFSNINLRKAIIAYETNLKKFAFFTLDLAQTMDELDQRMSFLSYRINPNCRVDLPWEICSYRYATVIAMLSKKHASNYSCERATWEMSRLNRRMDVVVREAEFIKFSERSARRMAIIKRISKFHVDFNDKPVFIDKVRQVLHQEAELKRNICEHRLFTMLKLKVNINKFKLIKRTYISRDYYRREHEEFMMNTQYYFEEISDIYKMFRNRFHELRILIDEVWNYK